MKGKTLLLEAAAKTLAEREDTEVIFIMALGETILLNINVNNNEIIMIGDKELGVIKKMKDKVVISIDNINITFKGNDNLDYEFFELVLKKCL